MDLTEFRSLEYKLQESVEIRRAGKGDGEFLASLATTIAEHYTKAPRWHPVMPAELLELRAGWTELAEDDAWQVWLAMDKKEALGSIGYTPHNQSNDNLLANPNCTRMSVAATKESARGLGIRSTLTWLSLEEMRRNGYRYCHTDWQTANLLAARF